MGSYMLGSQFLRVGLDSSSLVDEVYYTQRIGSANHTPGSIKHRVGIYVDGQISWMEIGDTWDIKRTTMSQALIYHTVAENKSLGVILEFIDTVDDEREMFLRNIHVINTRDNDREIKLFMHQAFIFNSNSFDSSSGSYSTKHESIVHSGSGVSAAVRLSHVGVRGFDEHTIGRFGGGLDGTYMDASDGRLERCDFDYGSIDSTMGLTLKIAAMSSERVCYAMALASKPIAALEKIAKLDDVDIANRIQEVSNQWRNWLSPALKVIDRIEASLQSAFLTSIMTLRAHLTSSGAVLTHRPNGEILYSSPRIAGYILWPLIRLGYHEEAEKYFDFIDRSLMGDKDVKSYYSSNSVEGYELFPIYSKHDAVEIDNAAILIFIFSQLYSANPSKRLLDRYYLAFIVPLLDNIANRIDRSTGLPEKSYSILNNKEPVQATFTASVVYAALIAGADLAEIYKDPSRAVGWRSMADEVIRGVDYSLIKDDRSGTLNFVGETQANRETNPNLVIDSLVSSYGLFIFGLAPSDDKCLDESCSKFTKKSEFSSDYGYRVTIPEGSSIGAAGQDFPVASLWFAQYQTERDNEVEAIRILKWVRDVYLEPYLPERVTEERREMSELATLWTRAELVSTILDIITDPGDVK